MVSDTEPKYRLVNSDGNVVGSLYAQADGTLAIQEGTSGSDNEATLATDGTLGVPAVNTDKALNSAIGDSVDYLDPSWLARTDADWIIETFPSFDHITQTTSGSGSVSFSEGRVALSTGSTSGSQAKIDRAYARSITTFGFGSDRTFRIGPLILDSNSDRTDYLTTGDPKNGEKGFGFKLTGGDIQGVSHDGSTETTVTLTTFAVNDQPELRAEFTNGEDIVFYVDGTQEGTISSGLPNSGGSQPAYACSIENSTAADRRIRFGSLRVVQHP